MRSYLIKIGIFFGILILSILVMLFLSEEIGFFLTLFILGLMVFTSAMEHGVNEYHGNRRDK